MAQNMSSSNELPSDLPADPLDAVDTAPEAAPDAQAVIAASQESAEAPTAVSRQQLSGVHAAATPLLHELAKLPDGDQVAEIIATAVKLLHDDTNRGDIKLLNSSLKELRYALKIFAPYREIRKVSIFGSARTPTTAPDYISAAAMGKAMADAGWMVITGAGGGIMAAGHGGAGPKPSFGLAIRLPFEQKTNEFIEGDPKLITFKYFFTRKLMFLRSSHAIVAFPGGFGTMDEGFEVLTLVQTGKSVPIPIVFVDAPGGDFWKTWQKCVVEQLLSKRLISAEDLHLYKITDNVDEAVAEVCNFYKNYHSIRYVRDLLVMRLHKAPTPDQLAVIRKKFADLLTPVGSPAGTAPKADFQVSGPLSAEKDETALSHLARLTLPFNRRDHGKLRLLIDHLNELV